MEKFLRLIAAICAGVLLGSVAHDWRVSSATVLLAGALMPWNDQMGR